MEEQLSQQSQENPVNPDVITRTAFDHFGILAPLPYQRLVINSVLCAAGFHGEEAADEEPKERIIILPTGAGKSLCFMLPALLVKGITLVVFPLRSLMSDQLRRCREAGINAEVLKGGMTDGEKKTLYEKSAGWESGMILTNMEMLLSAGVLDRLSRLPITHLVFDEVHTLFEWGESFRPALLRGAEVISRLQPSITSAFTATASPEGIQKIRSLLFDERSPVTIAADPDRPNISYHLIPSYSRIRTLRALFSNLKTFRQGLDPDLPLLQRPAVIFFRNRMDTEKCAAVLQRDLPEIPVYRYHAGLPSDEKERVETDFFNSDSGILCSTNAYGMGVDKSNIRTVIHAQFPPTIESFLQESGRAGRDREPAQSWLMVRPLDLLIRNSRKKIVKRELPETLLRYVMSLKECRRAVLMKAMGKESELCGGCDICLGRRLRALDQEKGLLRAVKWLKKTVPPPARINLLTGSNAGYMLSIGAFQPPGYQMLLDWSRIEVEELIEQVELMHRYQRKSFFSSYFNVDKSPDDCFNR